MGVYNGDRLLEATIASIVEQSIDDWEFLIVDDASTDLTPDILAAAAQREPRIQVVRHATNRGLTAALNTGSLRARGEFIARQDCGDTSMKSRFAEQLAFLKSNPAVIAVGAGIRRVGPRGEYLGDVIPSMSPADVTDQFIQTGKAIVHATAMIRTSAFVAIGGYRPEFRVAQDIDLWYRLSAEGLLAEIPTVLCCIGIDVHGISATTNSKQHWLAALARACYEARQTGLPETTLLAEAKQASWGDSAHPAIGGGVSSRLGEANYFLGSELLKHRNPGCRRYLRRSIYCRHNVLRATAKYLMSFLSCSAKAQDQAGLQLSGIRTPNAGR